MPDPTVDRIITIPNVLSAFRLLLVPLFVWLALVPHADLAAVAVLVVSGITDWLDGLLARKLHQQSRLGQLLDPIADRLFIVAAVVVLALRHIVPWWLIAVILARDLLMLVVQARVRREGWTVVPVNLVGKAATLCLLYALPLLLIADSTWTTVLRPLAWAFTWWGIGLYWWSAVLYIWQAGAVLQGRPLRLRV